MMSLKGTFASLANERRKITGGSPLRPLSYGWRAKLNHIDTLLREMIRENPERFDARLVMAAGRGENKNGHHHGEVMVLICFVEDTRPEEERGRGWRKSQKAERRFCVRLPLRMFRSRKSGKIEPFLLDILSRNGDD